MIDDDFNPDVHAPVERLHCLEITWFDDDCMPSVCAREPHIGGNHVANIWGGNVRIAGPVIEWPASDETKEEVA